MNATEVIQSMDINKIQLLFKGSKPAFDVDQNAALKQYKVEGHDIFDKTIRKDKDINKDVDGTTVKTQVPVARIGMTFQELIVDRRVGFMLSNPVTVDAIYQNDENKKETDLVAMIERIQNENKMDYKNWEIATRMMSEMECAEVWYWALTGVAKPKYTLKVKILSYDLGDMLYPLFDNTGDMIAFARGYKLKEGDKEIDHFDVYTADLEYKYVVNTDNQWVLDPDIISMTSEGEKKVNPIPNPVGKIMVIYHSQKAPEWTKVQAMIDRRETLSSNHADMNDYFGSPMIVAKGDVKGFSAKGEQGRILELEGEDASANYLTWDSSPVSIKDEKQDLNDSIFMLSQTPDISFASMKGLGTIAQFTMKAYFMDAHMAVRKKENSFGIGLQRRLNLIKAAIGAVIDTTLAEASRMVQVKPVITPYLPENTTEQIENLTVAKTSGIISQQSAVEQSPLTSNSEVEMERLSTDAANANAGL